MNGRQRQAWRRLDRSTRRRWTVKRLLGLCFDRGCRRRWAVVATVGGVSEAGEVENLIELHYCRRHAAEVTAAVLPAADQATLEYASGTRVTVPLNTEE